MSVRFDPVGTEMITASTAKTEPLFGRQARMETLLTPKTISSELNDCTDPEKCVIKSWDLCVKEQLATPL